MTLTEHILPVTHYYPSTYGIKTYFEAVSLKSLKNFLLKRGKNDIRRDYQNP